jgi:hypothetical protein
MTDTTSSPRWTLRDLPFAARLTLAVFLVSVGIGYFSALVNLHFQSASPGESLPTKDDVISAYSGRGKTSQLERLLVAHPSHPFNGQGSMRSAFTQRRAGGWQGLRKAKAKELKIDRAALENDPKLAEKVDREVAKWLDGERLALIAWIRDGASKESYEEDRFELKGELAGLVINPKMVNQGPNGQPAAMIKTIIDTRCVRCHSENVGGPGAQYPLDKYEDIANYLHPETTTGMSLQKLALSTHVHLLGFSMLYGLTGLLLALTSYRAFVRVPLAPMALLAQVVDISFWWLARLDGDNGPMFAQLIPVSGGVVAIALGLQILLTLFDLFSRSGKYVLLFLIVITVGGGYPMKERVIDKYLASEKSSTALEHPEK